MRKKNINVPRRLSTGVPAVLVIFQLHFQARVLALLFLLLAFLPQFHCVGGAFALASSGLIIASKKLDSKIKKHQEIVTLAIAKRDTVDRLLSKALADNQMTDSEF